MNTFVDNLEKIKKETLSALTKLQSYEEIERLEFDTLGRKGVVTESMKGIAALPVSEKPNAGKVLNEVKIALKEAFDHAKSKHQKANASEAIDITLPGIQAPQGHLHPITYAIEEIETIFARLGFTRVRYNEVEWDYFAFEALNMPSDHPARDDWETFFITEKPIAGKEKGRILLTPHTSSGQVREMKRHSAKGEPIRMLNIAKTYRRQIDITHVPMFHQFEGLVVDKEVTITQLIGVLQHFVKEFFGPDRRIRLRPYNFRFTEPSFEIDISCGICAGVGCNYCKEGWSELGGAGMVHEVVLRHGGYDPAQYTGFAFGFGVERTYLMKNNLNIGDLRTIYSNDMRFLEQF